ncbi:GntR family transcriptional regulator [Brachybacterium halotolerans subsp. kimchii]|uniref:GntR family transcriptional regulator n=1 Tax=Brachybacterium halotolerans TaxID=2795215 RepID=UPI001E654727|nr:GntR family transcriptional regulator [Brachybacterium halotolerans]UEJ81546.1 GntR family transcriptional regulator [Brachybacterium halotolerans subsp. kimchii]
MYTQVARSKRQSIVDTLAGRIRAGEYEPGAKLEGEHRLAEEFGVSRSTIRQALSELQHQRLIATETGRGSFVIFDGHQLDQDRGWTQSMAAAGSDVSAEILAIEAVERSEVPLLPADVALSRAVAVRRVRSLRIADGQEVPVSFECATVPAVGMLADLPTAGLVEGSLASSLQAAGFVPVQGIQRADVRLLDEREARILRRDAGEAFLRTARTSFDADGRFVEHVVSLLDPRHFTLALSFGGER